MCRSQRVLEYRHSRGRWYLSSPVSFPCRGENSSSLPRTVEKTNVFCSAKCHLKRGPYFKGPLDSEEITHPHVSSSAQGPHVTLQVSAQQRTGRKEMVTEIQAEHSDLKKIIKPWAAMGVNSYQGNKKTISRRFETQSLGKLRKPSHSNFSISHGHWAWFSTTLHPTPHDTLNACEKPSGFKSYFTSNSCSWACSGEGRDGFFYILILQDYTAAAPFRS